ncbi:MAG: response regulator, partial [Chloroflexota bacterium]
TRIYNLLHLHYVGGMTIQEVAQELGISVRQAYRDLKKGQDSVTSVLWFTFGQEQTDSATEDTIQATAQPQTHTMDTLSSVDSEITRIGGTIETISLASLIQRSLSALEPLSQQHNVTVKNAVTDDARISTNLTIARQAMMTLLSQIIQQSPAHISLNLKDTAQHTTLVITHDSTQSNAPVPNVVQQLATQLGWIVTTTSDEITLQFHQPETTVLLIDDNIGLVDLMKRYLSDQSYRVLTTHTGIEGLQIAQAVQPDVIIMDIMMPEMDGWEVLQRLRTFNTTCHIPVVVCSVINDPQLARSLGASKFVAKPIDKEKLLQSLSELLS